MLYKKTLLNILFFCWMLVSNFIFAHSPDFSNIIISKTESGQIILQANTSLTAFQQEVNYVNGEGAYKSPEEFQKLVLNHFYNNFSIVINNKDTLQFKNPKVYLGHETKLVAEIIGLPKTVNSIYINNNLFKDIHRSESIVIFLLEGFPKEKHTLNRSNNYELNISLKNESWENMTIGDTPPNLSYLLYLCILIIIVLIFFFIRKKFN